MELPKPFSHGPLLAAGFGLPQKKAVQVVRIEPGTGTQNAGSEARRNPGQDRTAAEARDLAALRREMDRRSLPPGPPPAFKLNLLELDQDLQRAIARAEAGRAGARATAPLEADNAGAANAREATAAPDDEMSGGPDGALRRR